MGNCLGRCLSGKNNLRHSTDEQEAELMPDETSDQMYIFKIMKFKRKKRSQFIDNFWEHKDLTYSRLSQTNAVESSDIQLQCLDAQNLLITARESQSTKPLTNHVETGVASSSRTSSSLDLEWEHEYGHNSTLNRSWLFLPEEVLVHDNCNETNDKDTDEQCDVMGNMNIFNRNNNHFHTNGNGQKVIIRTPSKTSWSHISTPESLEWDIDEEQQKQLHVEDDNLDHETLELLHQIEILKNKVLNETGEGLALPDS